MNKDLLTRTVQLLKNYDEKLRDKSEHIADMMADWAEASQAETIEYAKKYEVIRIERQRVRDNIMELEIQIDIMEGHENGGDLL